MSKLNIGGVDLELNLLDADVVEKYENVTKEMVANTQNPDNFKGLSNADQMRKLCGYVNSYFDELFGAGTSEKIFPKNNDLGVRMDAFAQTTALSGEAKKFMDNLQSKYNPQRAQNRQERRANNRNKNKHNN